MDRKKFLKTIPIIGVAGGLTLSGCSTGTGNDDINLSADAEILTEAAEREAVAIQSYNAAAESGLLTTQAVLDTAVLYRVHHTEHLEIFNELILEAEGQRVELSNFGPDPLVNNLNENSSEADVIRLAMTLELQAARAYFAQSTIELQSPNSRQRMGEIFPVEVAHFVTLNAALGANPNVAGASLSDLVAAFTPFS
jgi:hypothetical protein